MDLNNIHDQTFWIIIAENIDKEQFKSDQINEIYKKPRAY